MGKGKSGRFMPGSLVDGKGNPINPCNAYIQRGLPCPSVVSVGVSGAPDIVPVAALLEAAGVPSLDQAGSVDGQSGPGNAGQSLRYSGLILFVQITYTNYFGATHPAVRPWGAWIGDPTCRSHLPPPRSTLPQVIGTGSLDENTIQYIYQVTVSGGGGVLAGGAAALRASLSGTS